jgi:signal transduction histidine kinase
VKHSRASEVRVSLTLQKDSFVLSVDDNGCGLNGSAVQPDSDSNSGRIESGNGLANMKLRLEEIRGRCELSSETGRGTCVKFTVPLKYINVIR